MDQTRKTNMLREWKKKRRITMFGYLIIGSIVGIDYSVILSTLYIYLCDVIHTPYPNLCYGAVVTLFNISSTLSGAISGRWVDKTRKIKRYINVILVLQIAGNLMYAIPYSVAFPIIGRILAGISDPFSNVCTGEVLRIYTGDEGTRALWWLASTYSIGFVAGPGIAIFFRHINFNIASIHVNRLNFVGLFIALLGIIALVVSNIMLYDCSAQFDLKAFTKDREMNSYNNDKERSDGVTEHEEADESCEEWHEDQSEDEKSINEAMILKLYRTEPFEKRERAAEIDEFFFQPEHHKRMRQPMPIWSVIKGLGTNVDAILLFVSTFVLVFSLFGTDVLVPLLVENVFRWPMEATSYIFIVFGICYFVVLIVMSTYFTSGFSIYVSTMICIISQLLQYVILYAITVLSQDKIHDIVLFSCFFVCWVIGWCIDAVLIRSLVANMVPSNVQSFTETLRSGVARLATILASFSVPLLVNYLNWCSLVLFVMILFIFVGFVMRLKYFVLPQEIQQWEDSDKE